MKIIYAISLVIAVAVLGCGCTDNPNYNVPTSTPVPHEIVYIVDMDISYDFDGFVTPILRHEEFFTFDHAERYIQSKLDTMVLNCANVTNYSVRYTGSYTITEYDKEYITERVVKSDTFDVVC